MGGYSRRDLKLLFCIIILNNFIQIQPKITIPVDKLEEKLKIFAQISYFSQNLHLGGNSAIT